ncbi:MAG: pilus assembly PilX N-terminal domain-containing protein [Longimicrobiales bacterium]
MHDSHDIRGRRDGFAIPLALMLVVFLTVGVTTAFTRITAEARVDDARQARADAFSYAQRGLEEFAADRVNLGFTSLPPAAAESARIAMPEGHADVILSLVQPKTATRQALYLLRSRGVKRTGNLSWMPPAEHTVTQFAFFREGEIQILSAWTSLSGLIKNGGNGTITGNDGCAVEPPVGGVAVPDNNYAQSGGGGAVVPTGNPPIIDLGSPPGAYDAVKIDWDGIVNYNAIWPDIVYPTDPWPSSFASNYWPVIRVDGNLDLPADGQGLLIVTGDMVINGSLQWNGVLLVGGILYANGNNNVQGAVISGLNVKFGWTVTESDVGNGVKTYQYNSCSIANAMAQFATLILLGGSWSDNYDTW